MTPTDISLRVSTAATPSIDDRVERQFPTERAAAFAAEVLEAALTWVRTDRGPAPSGVRQQVLETELDEQPLRKRLEDTYRVLAKLADSSGHRHAMVKRANAVRPRTLF